MLTLERTNASSSTSDPEQKDSYPDEVLNSEWNPVLAEVQSLQSIAKKTITLVPKVVDATSAVHLNID